MADSSNVHNLLDELIPEDVLSDEVTSIQYEVDPLTSVMVTSERVRQGGFSQGWEIDIPVRGGLAGVIEAKGSTSSILYGPQMESVPRLMVQEAASVDGDPLLSPKPKGDRIRLGLQTFEFLLPLNRGELRQMANPATRGDILGDIMRGFSTNIAQTRAVYLYAETYGASNSPGVVGRLPDQASANFEFVGNIDATGSVFDGLSTFSGDNADIIQYIVTDYSIHRYMVGMLVDIHANNGGVPATSALVTKAIVIHVDPMENRVVLCAKDGLPTAANTKAELDDAWVFLPGGYGNSLNGIESWLKDSGRLWNATTGLPLAMYPEYKSYVKSSVGALTEQKLVSYLTTCRRAFKRQGHLLDTLIMNPETINEYAKSYLPTFDRSRGAGAYTVDDGFDGGFKINAAGYSLTAKVSDYISPTKVYGFKMGGGNIRRYAPPRPASYSDMADGVTNEQFMEVQYTGKASGYATNWVPLNDSSTGRGTDTMYLRGESAFAVYPDNPAGLLLSGVNYDRVLSDDSLA